MIATLGEALDLGWKLRVYCRFRRRDAMKSVRGILASNACHKRLMNLHMACALPEVEWLEYSFQNFDHLVEQPVEIRGGWAYAPDRPGHGLVLSETARHEWARPELVPRRSRSH